MLKGIRDYFLGYRAEVNSVSYPAEILSHSGKPLPVSKGGIVLINDTKDLPLLLEDGITCVELDRDLGDDFYRAAEEAGEDVVNELSRLFRHLELSTRNQYFHNSVDAKAKYSKAIDEFKTTLNGTPHIVVRQAMDDIIDLYEPFNKLNEKVATILGKNYDEPFSFSGGYQRTGSDFGQNLFFHTDELEIHGSARGGLSYVGQTTIIVDDRLSEKDIRKVVPSLSQSTPPEVASMISYSYKLARPKLGNPFFLKAYTGWHDPDGRGFDPAETIRNTSVHSGPELKENEPRFSHFFNLS